ncbi:MAG: hypothetical protein COX65_09645 [Elusimicrobia bacterium CG_4_10_14_0_2_um_filter_56_8]|nr:MAG: hypothetical protein AUJ51_08775 [Elusimicrobia bacterium CG1_02_56_21]PJA11791.1 MAG: hypothetical protein COX65_09645 [Elusimicrobia bacterium CG_4_10_14_0_2_um_filter_56_8]
MSISELCRDVRSFLNGLASELPDIFPAPRQPRPSRRGPGSPVLRDAAGRKEARQIIIGRVEYLARRLGLEYGRVFVKDQRTLWGSCSGRKNLNFNWRLAAAPQDILDYVVIHELCHLREMNHSRKFWDLVRAACPDYPARRKWLRDNCALVRTPAPLAAREAAFLAASLNSFNEL